MPLGVALGAARSDAFGLALGAYTAAMLVAAVQQATAYASARAPSAAWILAGVALSVAGGAVQVMRLAPHPRFNHNDLYHVIQMGALYLFYRGGLLLVDA